MHVEQCHGSGLRLSGAFIQLSEASRRAVRDLSCCCEGRAEERLWVTMLNSWLRIEVVSISQI